MKSQLAMEYLMSYGWAILIIAVVLGVLFQLGVFSGSALTPKAQAGACQVQRLLGQVSLEGLCQGQLPQFIGQFNGANGYVTLSNLPTSGSQSFTITAWINTPSISTRRQIVTYGANPADQGVWFFVNSNNKLEFDLSNVGGPVSSATIADGTWHFAAVTNNGGTIQLFIDGSASGSPMAMSPNIQAGNQYIGSQLPTNPSWYFQGQVGDVQIYNTSLSANEVSALHLEGIGGAPVRLQNLVGWWPLNGDAKDYSGNNNNGQISGGVSFNSTWNSQYTPP